MSIYKSIYRPGLKGIPAVAILLAILIGSSAGQIRAPAPPPVKLYILDFDNLAGSERLEWLTKALKDMVLLRLEDEPRLVGKDAGKIAPFLDKRPTAKPGVKGLAGDDLLVMGAYHREDARLVVTLQLFDMQSWTRLSSDAVEALYSDIPLINQLLVAKVLAMVDAVKFASGFTLSGQAAAVKELRTFEGMRPSPELRTEEYAARAPAVREDLERAVADLELAMDEYSGYRQETSPTVQEADRYSREFDLTGKGALPEEREQHTRLFEEVLRQVGDNPYSAEIGDLDLVVDPYDDQRVYLNIPIKYSVKEGLLEDMLYSLPYASTREAGGLRTIRYDKSKFNFSAQLLRSISRGDYSITPVIELLDGRGNLRAAVIDSPDLTWERYFPAGSPQVVRQKRFTSMVAVTTGGYNVDVRLTTDDLAVTYVVDMDISQLTSQARVVVRFMKQRELEQFLRHL